ncbi:MAG: enoyl-CoA hydratase [Ignavibacteriae bacterium]|nr:enoyl-CoA hydratase [Ignavibacteriota bacterium]NOG97331.1 enoyl-CoA hydratase [Ignavibacteriota bacterium]
MDLKNLIYSKTDGIATVTINRPEKLNALNSETMTELHTVFTAIKKDDAINLAILTGAGEKAFVAGADIAELNKLNVISGKEFAEKGQVVFDLIENLEKPVIAAVNGFALGGGCELALACHIRIASENAKFGQPEVNLGVIPGYGGTQRLARLINKGRALEMILTGDMVNVHEAYRLGIVNYVVPQNELMEKVNKIASKISSKGQVAIRMAVKAVVSTEELSQQAGQNFEASLFGVCCGSEDFKEGTSAFLEKRKPKFEGK